MAEPSWAGLADQGPPDWGQVLKYDISLDGLSMAA